MGVVYCRPAKIYGRKTFEKIVRPSSRQSETDQEKDLRRSHSDALLNQLFQDSDVTPSLKTTWLRFPVRPEVTLPRRCFYCQFFGWCVGILDRKLVVFLLSASTSKQRNKCTAEIPRYTKCSDLQPTSLKSCDRYLFEKEVVSLKTLKKLDFAVVRDRVLSFCVRPSTTFVSLINNNPILRPSSI